MHPFAETVRPSAPGINLSPEAIWESADLMIRPTCEEDRPEDWDTVRGQLTVVSDRLLERMGMPPSLLFPGDGSLQTAYDRLSNRGDFGRVMAGEYAKRDIDALRRAADRSFDAFVRENPHYSAVAALPEPTH